MLGAYRLLIISFKYNEGFIKAISKGYECYLKGHRGDMLIPWKGGKLFRLTDQRRQIERVI